MIADILTVMWKERKLLFRQGGSRFRTVFVLVVPLIMVGVFLPWQEGAGWIEGYWSLLGSVLIPLLLVGMVIPESFAGERERHTLGTLLASRLSDQAILFGKVAVAVGYGWAVAILALALGLVTVNIAHWDGQLMFFTPGIALSNVALSLVMAVFMADLGVLISLRSATVQGATQLLMGVTFLPLIVLQIVALVLLQMGPGVKDNIGEFFASINPTHVLLIAIAVLVVVTLGLFWIAKAKFQREKLTLN